MPRFLGGTIIVCLLSMVSIAHAAALSPEDSIPFAHGVALARASGAKLSSIHAGSEPNAENLMPEANALLSSWGIAGNVEHERIARRGGDDPVNTTLNALANIAPDLVVMGTHQRKGLMSFLVGSHAEAIARNIEAPTLVIPVGSAGFVVDGEIQLRRVIVPVGDAAAAEQGCAAAKWFIELAKVNEGQLVLLHVGDTPAPTTTPTLPHGWTCERQNVAQGKLEQVIANAAEAADLIVMATHGHDSLGDVMMGSHTERVLHRAKCPVLSVRML